MNDRADQSLGEFARLFILLAGATINAQLGQFISTLPNSVNQIRDLMGQNALGRYIPDHMGQAQLGADDWHFAAFTLAFCWDGGTIRPQ